MSTPSLYDSLGGRAGLEHLIDTYLRILQTKPEAASLSAMYRRGFEHYRERMLEYLSGYLGGPGLYLQNHGLPMLREQHRFMTITPIMRDQWYGCMIDAIHETVQDPKLAAELKAVFWTMADSLCSTC